MMTNLLFSQLTAIGKRFAMVLTMLLVVGIGQAWGESIEINTNNSGVNGSYRDYEFDVSSITFGCTQWMKNTNIQAKKSTTNSFYNVDAIPGIITSVVVKQTGTARAIKIYGGTSSKPTTQITSPNTDAEMTFDFTGKNYTYFSLTTPDNACYFDKITINYTPSSGGDSGDDNTGGGGDCNVWKLITDASDLKVGDQIVIAAKGVNKAMGKNSDNGNNRTAVNITKDNNNTITFGNEVKTITLGTGKKENTFAFEVEGDYLYAASSKSNYLKTKSTLDDNGSWTIAIASDGVATIEAQGTNTRNTMQYNNGSTLFACYASANQSPVCIYKYVACGSTQPTHYLLRK